MPSLLSVLLSVLLLAPVALGGGHPIAEAPLGPSAYTPHQPLVAFAGNRYLTVWVESLDAAGYRVLGAFSDRNGTRLSPSAFVVATGVTTSPVQLLGTGDSFALFFPAEDAAVMIDIDVAGHVSSPRTIAIEDFERFPSIAWNGTHFVTVENTRAVLITRNGTIARRITIACRPLSYTVRSAGSDVIVASVCSTSLGLRLERIANDRVVVRTALDTGLRFFEAQRFAAAPAANGGVLVAYTMPGSYELRTVMLGANGKLSAAHTIETSYPYVLNPLIVVPTAEGFLLPYLSFEGLRVATLSSDGTPVSLDESQKSGLWLSAGAASDGTQILVSSVESVPSGVGGRVSTRLIDAGASIGTTATLSIEPARQLAPALGAGSGSLVAVWTEKQHATSQVRAALLAPDGTPISSATIGTNVSLLSHQVAWNGSEYLIATARGGQLSVQRINAFGEAAGSATILPAPEVKRAAVVWAGDRWKVIATSFHAVFSADVSRTGELLSLKTLTLEGTLPDGAERTSIYDVAIAWNGQRAYVAWIEGQYFPCSFECIENRNAFVAALDEVDDPVRISDEWDLSEAVALTANENAIVATSTRYVGGLVTLATSFDASLTPMASRPFDGAADATWDGSTFVLALRERTQLTVRRVDASLRDAGRARTVEVPPADTVASKPSIAVVIPGNAVVGIQEVDANIGARAVAYAEQEIVLEPQRRRTVRR